MKGISLLVSVLLMLGCVSALNAAATIYGMSGLIETPDDTIVSAKTLAPAVSVIQDIGDSNATLTTYGGALGLLPNLEVSAVAVATDEDGDATEGILNGKFRLVAESVDKPSITVGVADMTQKIEDNVSAFVVFGKNISNVAEGFSGQVSKPVRGTIGFGTGIYRSIFAGLDIAVAPKCSLALEYLGTGLRDDSTFSGCVRFTPIPALSIQAGALDFSDFFAGASYNISTF